MKKKRDYSWVSNLILGVMTPLAAFLVFIFMPVSIGGKIISIFIFCVVIIYLTIKLENYLESR